MFERELGGFKMKCEHCGSTNTSEAYSEIFECEELGDLVEVELFDCLDCGERAQCLNDY